MIRVIKIDRKKALFVVLVLFGVVFCAAGFGGLAEQVLGLQDKVTNAATVTMTESKNENNIDVMMENSIDPKSVAVNELDKVNSSAFFVEYRMERERAMGKEVEMLREVLESSSADEEICKTANERLLYLSSNISQEMELENLIRARGFQDVAVFLDKDIVTVVLQLGKEMAIDAGKIDIAQLVSKTTGMPEENVIMITKED